jgi:2-polyprenyl-3-methyl-5-hydroxy-6-metoxy-1,4-benzoquinol methylase
MSKIVPFVPKRSTLLDVGTARGQLFEMLGDRIRFGIGMDSRLLKVMERGRYRIIPAEFPDEVPLSEKFDVITMLAVLEHFPKEALDRCCEICSSLLNPGGYVIITVPSKYVDRILGVLRSLRLVDAETLDEHHGFDISKIREIFPSGSFQLLYENKFQLGLNNMFVFRKK